MQSLITEANINQTLADVYPSLEEAVKTLSKSDDSIQLFDVVYASISQGEFNA